MFINHIREQRLLCDDNLEAIYYIQRQIPWQKSRQPGLIQQVYANISALQRAVEKPIIQPVQGL